MEWLSNLTYTIYSIGDGLFMSKVLNAIAMLSNSGFFQSLGLLGLMFALILMGFKGVATGKADFGNLFASLIVFSIMFGGKADVIIEDVGYSPGEYVENTYTVDNVPFGVATIGWAISNISYGITDRIEQAYGDPADSVGSTTTLGFGRSMAWMNSLKFMKQSQVPCTEDTLQFCRWKENVQNYLANCTARGFAADRSKMATARTNQDVWSDNALGYPSHWDTVDWLDLTTGVNSNITCATATPLLRTYAEGSLSSDWAKIASGRLGFSGQSDPFSEQTSVYDRMGLDPTVMGNFMTNIILDEQMKLAYTGIPLVDDTQKLGMVMLANGASQRADKTAGEESMFLLMMRPLMAFFESFVYIASPFMALVIGLGAFNMVLKYALTTLWVALWMPTLAAINMFQMTMMERAMGVLNSNTNPDVGSYKLASLGGAQAAYYEVMSWMSVGSMLAAATPAITLMLVYGSSQAAVSLANASSGAGFTNEKLTSPDMANTPSVANRGSEAMVTAASNYSVGGATQGQFSIGSAAKQMASEAQHSIDTNMQSWAQTGQSAASQVLSQEFGSRTSASDRAQLNSSLENSNIRTLAQAAGVDTRGMSNSDLMMSMAASEHVKADGKLGVGASKLIAAGVGVEGGQRFTDEQRQSASRQEQAAQTFAQHAKNDQGFRIAVASSVANVAEQMSHNGNSDRASIENRETLANAKQSMSSASNAYQTMKSAESLAAYGQNVPVNELAHKLDANPALAARIMDIASQSEGGIEAARGLMKGSGLQGESKGNLAAGAMIGIANGSIKADGGSTIGGAGSGLSEMSGILKELGYGGGSIDKGGVSNTTGAGSMAPDGDAVRGKVGEGTQPGWSAEKTEDRARSGGFTVGTEGADAARGTVAENVKTNPGGTTLNQEATNDAPLAKAFDQNSQNVLNDQNTRNAETGYARDYAGMLKNWAGDNAMGDGQVFNGMARNGQQQTVSQAMGLTPGGADENAFSGSFDGLKQSYMEGNGAGTQGTMVNEAAATVLAANAAVRNGESLSPEQQAEVRSADRSLSDVGQDAVRRVANSVSYGGDGFTEQKPAAVAPAISVLAAAPQINQENSEVSVAGGRGGSSAEGGEKQPFNFNGTTNMDGGPISKEQQDTFYGTNPEVSEGGPQSNKDIQD